MIEKTKQLCLIDSNILIYAYTDSDYKKHIIARNLIEKCWKKEVNYAISTQNLAEFFVVITKKVPNPLSIEEAEHIINDICAFSNWFIINYDQNILLKAMNLHKEKKKHFWDALIVATMLNSNVYNIYSENVNDFKLYEQINVINPFISSP